MDMRMKMVSEIWKKNRTQNLSKGFIAFLLVSFFAFNAKAQCTGCTINITSNTDATINTAGAVVCLSGVSNYTKTLTVNAANVTVCVATGVTFKFNGGLTLNGSSPTVNNFGTFEPTGLNANSGVTINNSGTWSAGVTLNGGTFNNNSGGTYSGSTTINGGTFSNSGTATMGSISTGGGTTITNNSGGTMNFTNLTVNGGGTYTNNGTSTVSGNLTVNNTLTNGGTITVTGSATVNSSATLTNSGTATINTGLTNNGTVTATGNTTVSGGVTNNSSATFTTSGGTTTINSGGMNNSGTVNAGGNWNITGAVTNSGTLNGGTSTSSCGSLCATSISNTGTMATGGGSLTLCQTVSGTAPGSNAVAPPAASAPTSLTITHTGNGAITGSFTAAPATPTPAPTGYIVLRRLGSAVDATASQINGNAFVGEQVANSVIVAILSGRTTTTFNDNISTSNGACGTYHYAVFPIVDPASTTNGCTAINTSVSPARGNAVVNYVGIPSLTAGGTSACAGTSVVYTAAATNATTYTFTLTGAGTSTMTGSGASRTINWQTGFSGTATLNITGNGCSGATRLLSQAITVTTATSISAQPPVTLVQCASNAATISVTLAGPVATRQWQRWNGSSWVNLNNGGVYSNVTTNALTISSVSGLNGDIYRMITTGGCGVSPTSQSCTLSVKNTGTWRGSVNNNWSNASNWCGGLPSASSSIIVDGTEINTLNVDTDQEVANLTVSGTGTVTVKASRTLTVNTDLANTGTLTSETGSTVRLNRSGNQNIPAGTYHNLDVVGSGTKTITGNITVNGNFTRGGTASITANSGTILTVGSASTLPTGTYHSINFSGSGVRTLGGSTTLNGTLTVASGQTVDLNGQTVTLAGSVSGAGLLRGNSGTLNITGSGNAGTLNFEAGFRTLSSLTINRSSAGFVSLGSDLTATSITCTNGNIETGIRTLTLGSGSISENTGSYVVGNLATTRTLSSGVANNFGGSGISITASGSAPGATTITRVTGTTFTGYAGNVSIGRKYAVSPTVNTGLNATMVLTYRQDEVGALTESNLVLYRSTDGGSTWDGGKFVPTRDLVNNTLTVTGLNGFSDWTAGDEDLPLPITLLHFSVGNQGTGVYANWQTSSEENLSHFEIQVSRDNGKTWQFVGRTEPSLNSVNGVRTYKFRISDPLPGGLYRLASLDIDGQAQFSAAVKYLMADEKQLGWGVFPNPAKDFTQIQINAHQDGELEYDIIDALGRVVTSFREPLLQGSHIKRIETSSWAAGFYMIRVRFNGLPEGEKRLTVN